MQFKRREVKDALKDMSRQERGGLSTKDVKQLYKEMPTHKMTQRETKTFLKEHGVEKQAAKRLFGELSASQNDSMTNQKNELPNKMSEGKEKTTKSPEWMKDVASGHGLSSEKKETVSADPKVRTEVRLEKAQRLSEQRAQTRRPSVASNVEQHRVNNDIGKIIGRNKQEVEDRKAQTEKFTNLKDVDEEEETNIDALMDQKFGSK